MASRIDLHDKLLNVLGNENVFFQPPESIKLKYPCIVYSRSKIVPRRADDKVYTKSHRYTITLIYKNPDDELPDKLMDTFQLINHDRQFMSNNLIHDVFTLYF